MYPIIKHKAVIFIVYLFSCLLNELTIVLQKDAFEFDKKKQTKLNQNCNLHQK